MRIHPIRKCGLLRFLFLAGVSLALTLLFIDSPRAADTGALEGKVVSKDGAPAAGAVVSLPDLRRKAVADKEGNFRLEGIPYGEYLIEVVSVRYGSAVVMARVGAESTAPLIVQLDLTVHQEKVSVTASPYAQGLAALSQSVTVVDRQELQDLDRPTLGETLSKEPGIASTYYSPGVSRPVIRGQGGPRVRILEEGNGVADASNLSEDHAVASDPMTADRIEVIRGSGTLLYGGNAIGGVINVLDSRVPSDAGGGPMTGSFEARYGSNADEAAGGVDLHGGAGEFGWHASGVWRESDDFKTPEGTLVNSDLETKEGSVGGSWIVNRGFVGVAFTRFETNYGIPDPAEPIRIDMTKNRYDLRGEFNPESGFLSGVKARISHGDYRHNELEDTGEVGVAFFNYSWEGRVEMVQREAGRLKGAFGLQYGQSDFDAVGDEAFVPPSVTKNGALFALEKIAAGPVDFEIGARFETQDNTVDDPALPDRSFDGVSASGGVIWKMPRDCALAFNLAHSARLPAAEELYANGPHLATFQFQVGDPDLTEETGNGADLTFRRSEGKVRGAITVFAQKFDDYIFLSPTGNFVDVDGELVPEFQYVQLEAEFSGAEAHVDFELFHSEPHHLSLELTGDTVHAENTSLDEPLPNIPPLRYGLGLHYRGDRWSGLLEARRASDQDRVAPNETTTDGYTLVNASVGYRLFLGKSVHDILLRGTNLGDELARNSVSFLKDIVPMPGRDVSLSYRVSF